jgi:hypothetical protein
MLTRMSLVIAEKQSLLSSPSNKRVSSLYPHGKYRDELTSLCSGCGGTSLPNIWKSFASNNDVTSLNETYCALTLTCHAVGDISFFSL